MRCIHDQLQFLKARHGDRPRPEFELSKDNRDSGIPKAVVKELVDNIRALEEKLMEKDKFYMSIVDELNTKLYYMESKMEAQSSDAALTKTNVNQLEATFGSRWNAWEDLHTSLKIQMDGIEQQQQRDRKAVDGIKAELEGRIESLRNDVLRLQSAIDTMLSSSKREESNAIALVQELRRKFTQLQDSQSGYQERLNRGDKEVSQLAYNLGETRRSLDQVKDRDIPAVHDLIESLRTGKAEVSDLELRAPLAALDLKADHSDLAGLEAHLRSIHAQLSAAMSSLDAKMHKKFSRLSDFTVRQLRQLPNIELADIGDTAGAGKMRCLVCDTPIKSIEGTSPYHPAKFYNTIGMLRYRNAFDDKGQREELRRVHDDCAPAVSGLPTETYSPMQPMSALEPMESPVKPKPIHQSKYDAVYESAKLSKRRPLSAPLGHSRSNGKVPPKQQA